VTPPGEAALVTSVEYSESERYESSNEPALMRSVAKFEFEFSTRVLCPRELKRGIASSQHLKVKDNALLPSQHNFEIYLRKSVPGSENQADRQQGE
jgi:hypothetical protein